MVERLRYAKNGIVTINNIQEHVNNNNFPRFPIGTIGGIDGWYFTMQIVTNNSKVFLRPFLHNLHKPKLLVQSYLNVLKKDGSSAFSTKSYGYLELTFGRCGYDLDIQMLLDEKNGYLNDNGGFLIEYGIQVISILGDDGIWKFNFFDKLFDSDKDSDNVISFRCKHSEPRLFCSKQLLSFQSSIFNTNNDGNHGIDTLDNFGWVMKRFLQIAHGVRVGLKTWDIRIVFKLSEFYPLSNVTSYCEQKLIEKRYGARWIQYASIWNLRHLLTQLLKKVKSSKELKTILKGVDIEEMSGETMKKLAKFFFDNSK